jgi:uncharacterized damage-inducible protein DinB
VKNRRTVRRDTSGPSARATAHRDARVRQLLDLIDQAYSKAAWHGPNLRGSIRGLDLQTASFRPGSQRKNIWEIVVHCAYWKYVARRRLLGEKRGSFPLAGSNWFARNGKGGKELWRSDVKLLDRMHVQLRVAIEGLSSRELDQTPEGLKVSNLKLLQGIASHDVYHAGQIQLLKRMESQR